VPKGNRLLSALCSPLRTRLSASAPGCASASAPQRTLRDALLVIGGLWTAAAPVYGQALVPHTLQLSEEQLQLKGTRLVQQAEQLLQFGQFQLALPRMVLATQLLPDRPRLWLLLGGLYLEANELDKSIAALSTARSLEPNNPIILFSLGSAYFAQEKYGAAAQYLQAGLRIQPDEIMALFNLGNTYYKLNDYDSAIAEYEKAVAQELNFWQAINNIGLVKYEQGDIEGAIAQWESAVEINSKAAEPQLALAVALYAQGDIEAGLAMAQAALQLDPNYADLEFLKENLWGERLMAETKKLLETPRIRETLGWSVEGGSPE